MIVLNACTVDLSIDRLQIAALVTSIQNRVSGSGAQLTAVSAAIKAQADFSKTVAARTDNPVPNPPPVVEPTPAPFA